MPKFRNSEGVIKAGNAPRKTAVIVSALSLAMPGYLGLSGSARGDIKAPTSIVAVDGSYDLESSFPNDIAAHFYLQGVNETKNGSIGSVNRYILDPDGKSFKALASDPNDPQALCQYDDLQWRPAKNNPGKDELAYLDTYQGCNGRSNMTTFEGDPPVFMPGKGNIYSKWKRAGVAITKFFTGGTEVCIGTDKWLSVVYPDVDTNGREVIHAHTSETQTWVAVPGAPPSPICPPRAIGVTNYEENFLIGEMPVFDNHGNQIGIEAGLDESIGGDKVVNWHVKNKGWVPFSNQSLNSAPPETPTP